MNWVVEERIFWTRRKFAFMFAASWSQEQSIFQLGGVVGHGSGRAETDSNFKLAWDGGQADLLLQQELCFSMLPGRTADAPLALPTSHADLDHLLGGKKYTVLSDSGDVFLCFK
jgi:hypothetical protein